MALEPRRSDSAVEVHNAITQLVNAYGNLLRDKAEELARAYASMEQMASQILSLQTQLRNATNGSEQIGKVP